MTPAPLRKWWPGLGVTAATLAAYWPALSAGFIWDDDGHVTRPELRSLRGLGRIWFQVGATQQYYPVLHSAFWLEHRLWGDAALGYHLVNVLLHAAAACLFAFVLSRLAAGRAGPPAPPGTPGRPGGTGGPALPWPWFAAFVFALHPACVESVAWISEQKNTLSTVFYLLAALTYLRWSASTSTRFPMAQSNSALGTTRSTYLLASFLFILALLSKSVTATLPAALLLVLWWRNGRLAWNRDVLPLLPWFAAGAAMGLFSAWVERAYIGAQGAHFGLSLGQRVLLAGRAIWFYLGKLIWPSDLIFIYPRWAVGAWPAWRAVFPLGVALLLAAAWLMRKRSRGSLAGLLFFMGSLFPALGFFNVYPFVFSYVADHFQYLASLGIFALAAGGWGKLFEGRAGPPAPPGMPQSLNEGMRLEPVRTMPRVLLCHGIRPGGAAGPALPSTSKIYPRSDLPLAIVILTIFCALTWRQCHVYRDMETLYRATVVRNPASWLGQENLGVVLANQGRRAEAVDHYRAALRLNPDYAETHANYANVLAYQHHWRDAAAEYREALRLRPDFALAAANWAQAEYGWASELGNGGHLPEAIAHYEQALRLRPDYGEAMAELGLAEAYSGRLSDAVAQLEKAVRLKPGSAPAHAYLGLALSQSGRLPEAVAEYRESLRLNPRDRNVHYQLGMALKALGQATDAADELEAARQPSPRGP